MNLKQDSFSHSQHEIDYSDKHLGIVFSTVAGVKYRFCSTADHNGLRIRSLATVLNDVCMYNGSTMPVLLKRAKYLKADPNAVSVVVTSQALCSSQDLFLQEDLHNAGFIFQYNFVLDIAILIFVHRPNFFYYRYKYFGESCNPE